MKKINRVLSVIVMFVLVIGFGSQSLAATKDSKELLKTAIRETLSEDKYDMTLRIKTVDIQLGEMEKDMPELAEKIKKNFQYNIDVDVIGELYKRCQINIDLVIGDKELGSAILDDDIKNEKLTISVPQYFKQAFLIKYEDIMDEAVYEKRKEMLKLSKKEKDAILKEYVEGLVDLMTKSVSEPEKVTKKIGKKSLICKKYTATMKSNDISKSLLSIFTKSSNDNQKYNSIVHMDDVSDDNKTVEVNLYLDKYNKFVCMDLLVDREKNDQKIQYSYELGFNNVDEDSKIEYKKINMKNAINPNDMTKEQEEELAKQTQEAMLKLLGENNFFSRLY